MDSELLILLQWWSHVLECRIYVDVPLFSCCYRFSLYSVKVNQNLLEITTKKDQKGFNLRIATFSIYKGYSTNTSSIISQQLWDNSIQILGLQEISANNLHIQNYTYITIYSLINKVGLGFLVRNDIEFEEILKHQTVEFTLLKLQD